MARSKRAPEVRRELSTGMPSVVRAGLRRAVSQYTRDVAGFKIGRTNNPDVRKHAYKGYAELIVIYQTDYPGKAVTSSDLTDFFEEADNFIRGGGGPSGAPPHFVYVVVEL
jgi:hypothetical protein